MMIQKPQNNFHKMCGKAYLSKQCLIHIPVVEINLYYTLTLTPVRGDVFFFKQIFMVFRFEVIMNWLLRYQGTMS